MHLTPEQAAQRDRLSIDQQRKAFEASVSQVNNQNEQALRQWCVDRAIKFHENAETAKKEDIAVTIWTIYQFMTGTVPPQEKSG